MLLLLLLHSLCRAVFLSWAPRYLRLGSDNSSPPRAGGSNHLWGHQRLFRWELQPHTLIGLTASPLSDQSLAAAYLSISASLSFPATWMCSPQIPILPNGSEKEMNVKGRARKWHLWQMELSIRRDGWSKVVSGHVWSHCFLCGCSFTFPCYLLSLKLSLSFFFFTAPKDKVKRVDSVETEVGEIRLLHQGRV